MNDQKTIEERLWDYIDGLGNAAEKTEIDQLIATNLEWQHRYHELLEAHQLLTSSDMDAPSLRFTKNVMEEIAKYHVAPATRSYINKKVIWGIGTFFLVMIVGFVVFAFSQVTWRSGAGTDTISKFDLSKIEWGKFFNSTYTNIFVMINVVLGLMLLDMYLQRKKKAIATKNG